MSLPLSIDRVTQSDARSGGTVTIFVMGWRYAPDRPALDRLRRVGLDVPGHEGRRRAPAAAHPQRRPVPHRGPDPVRLVRVAAPADPQAGMAPAHGESVAGRRDPGPAA